YQPDSNWEVPFRVGAGVLVVVALGAFLVRFLGWRTTHFVVTTDRCIYRSGVLKKTGIEIPLERINTVLFSQTLFERMLNAGDLSIESAGESSRQNFSDIRNPIQVQNLIYQQIEDNENRKYDRIGAEAREAAAASAGAAAGAAAAGAAAAPQPTQVMSVAEQLHKLAELRDRNVLTEEQFEAQKRALLGD
ncbi:MAG: PH domain-containing protein, partial [Actinobacteria bacterium]|nr:PH domain-containing protein [Actinomycetota bacterium]